MKKQIIPAIIAKDQHEFDTRINKVNNLTEIIHLDIADNTFVPNTSLNFDYYFPNTCSKFEAHLMINNPYSWIKSNWWKVDTIIVHIETCNNIKQVIKFIKSKGKNVGLAISPETPISKVTQYLDQINQLTIVTVDPGFYGNDFITDTLIKIAEINGPNINIEIDGGITPNTISQALNTRANMFVSGSYLLNSPDIEKAIHILKANIK